MTRPAVPFREERRKSMKLTVIAAAVLAVLPVSLAASEEEAKAAYLEGWYLETAERDHGKAVEAYRKVLDAKPSDRLAAQALLRTGICLKALGKEDEARKAFEEIAAKHASEIDLAARAKRLLEGKPEEVAGGLTLADPRAEVLSFLGDMSDHEKEWEPQDLNRALAILRLATPEYVREVVLLKHPGFAKQFFCALGNYESSLPEGIRVRRQPEPLPAADPRRLLSFAGIPDLRDPIFRYLEVAGDAGAVPLLLPLLDSSDADLRSYAAEVLGALRTSEAAPRIIEIFQAEKDRSPRQDRLLSALGDLRAAGAVPEIRRRIEAEEIEISTAVSTLSKIATPEAIEALRPLFLLEKDKYQMVWNWMGIEPPAEGDAAAAILAIGLDSDDPRQAYAALRRVPDLMEIPAVEEKILPRIPDVFSKLLALPDASVLEEVADIALHKPQLQKQSRMPRKGSATQLPSFLRRRDAKPLGWAKDVFQQHKGRQAAAPVFRKLLATPLAEEAMGFFLSHREYLPDFFDALKVGPPELRELALQQVDRPSTNLDLLTRIATDRALPVPVRARVLTRALRGNLSPAMERLAVDVLGDPDDEMVIASMGQIAQLAGNSEARKSIPFREALRRLLAVEEGSPVRPTALREAALAPLVKLGDVTGLLVALRDPLPRIRLLAAEALKGEDQAYRVAVEAKDLLLQRHLMAKMDPMSAGKLEILYGSTFEEIRGRVIEAIGTAVKAGHPSQGQFVALAAKALRDPAAKIRKMVMGILQDGKAWDPLIAEWDRVAAELPWIALEAAQALERKDLLEALWKGTGAEIAAAAAAKVLELSETPEELISFLSGPATTVLKIEAVRRIAGMNHLPGLARMLVESEPAIAAEAVKHLHGFSAELREVLRPFLPAGETWASDFGALHLEKRREASVAVARWAEAKGKAALIGRAKELLSEEREAAEEMLIAALPEPEAVEMLASGKFRPDRAAYALAGKKLREPLLRVARVLEKAILEGKQGDEDLLDIEEVEAVLKSLARVGEGKAAANWIGKLLASGRARFQERKEGIAGAQVNVRRLGENWSFAPVVLTSAEAGPEGPLPFLDLLSKLPGRDAEAKALIEALKRARSAEGLRRALAELPQPPAREIFDALIAIGEPEPVLAEALQGTFWLEAASALRAATGDWFGYLGPGWTAQAAEKAGPGSVKEPGKAEVRFLDPAARKAAVEAWREALEKK
jgi:tetratricopeptide (TPR) repeat protein